MFKHWINSNPYAQINNLIYFLFFFLVLVTPLIYFHDIRDASSLPRYAFIGVISGLLLTLTLINKLSEHRDLNFNKPILIPVLCFVIWIWLSLSWSVDPKNSIIELIQMTGCILVGFSISQFTPADKTINRLFILCIISASIVSLIGLLQYFNYNPFKYHQFSIPASTFTNPNFATIYLDFMVPLAFAYILIAKTTYYKWLAVTASILCLCYILVSHSRGSWLGLIFVLIGLIWLIYKIKHLRELFFTSLKINKIYISVAIIIPLIIFSLPSKVPSNQPVKNSQVTFDGSAKIRLHAYINSIDMIKDNPILGVGYGGFRIGFRDYMFSSVPIYRANEDNNLVRLHSDPLQFFVELGIIGGLLAIYIFFILLISCWNIIKKTEKPALLFLYTGLFLALIGHGIHALVDFPYHKPASNLMFWIIAGTIATLSTKVLHSPAFHLKRLISIPLVIIGIVFTLYNIQFYQSYIKASKLRLMTENKVKRGDCDSAKINVNKMINIFDADFHHQALFVAVYSNCNFSSDERIAAMNRILSYDKKNTRAYITRGTLYLNQRLTKEAEFDFLQVSQILPHKASGYIGLAYIAFFDNDLKKAERLLHHALKLESDNQIAQKFLYKIEISHK